MNALRILDREIVRKMHVQLKEKRTGGKNI
jgi:hypothetical protein